MRTLPLSEDFAEELVLRMLLQDLETAEKDVADAKSLFPEHYHHPEDIKIAKKYIKAFKRVISYYSVIPYKEKNA